MKTVSVKEIIMNARLTYKSFKRFFRGIFEPHMTKELTLNTFLSELGWALLVSVYDFSGAYLHKL